MKYPQHVLCSDDISSDDEIDHLFNQLPLIEPPEELVERILTTVSRLPRPQFLPPPLWDGFDGLIVHHNDCEPS